MPKKKKTKPRRAPVSSGQPLVIDQNSYSRIIHRLRNARISKGWSQTEAATHLGIERANLNAIEKLRRRATPELLNHIAGFFGLTVINRLTIQKKTV
tara:strand:- start:156 stop:446 length:291 start_codon:yes stop_codon:yes gene_type:complete